ncbi:hypothetical protein [Clostridium sp.]|uniref:hypothetical protein n=1 Tax=Clostridium sp. TaxID=1506 RepID=UPI0026267719|nr:hypothetical protein [Clostridium sp.]
MFNKAIEKIYNELRYYKNLTHVIENGILKFYYWDKSRMRMPKLLRTFVERNFKENDKFYEPIEVYINNIKSDYNYYQNNILKSY